MKKLITTFILLLIAIILAMILMPLSFIYTSIRSIKHKGFNKYLYECAIAIDIAGNVICQYLLNDWMVKPDGYRHGSTETISKVLGKNKINNKQYPLGKFISNILNKIDKNHVEKAAKNIN